MLARRDSRRDAAMLPVAGPREVSAQPTGDGALGRGVGSTTLCSSAKSQAFASDSSLGAERPLPTRWPISWSAMK